jgi:hypothetical protein
VIVTKSTIPVLVGVSSNVGLVVACIVGVLVKSGTSEGISVNSAVLVAMMVGNGLRLGSEVADLCKISVGERDEVGVRSSVGVVVTLNGGRVSLGEGVSEISGVGVRVGGEVFSLPGEGELLSRQSTA